MIEQTARPRSVSRLRPLAAALTLICLIPCFSAPVSAIGPDQTESRRLTPAEETLLSLTLAEYAPEATYAARVGMAAAVLGRMRSPACPDALPEVLEELRTEGAFGGSQSSGTRAPGDELPGRIAGEVSDLIFRIFSDAVGTGTSSDRRLTEISLHAVRAAEAGADPACGALSFRIVRVPRTRDFLFNDAGEDARQDKIADALREYPLILGEVGFR